MKKGYIIILFCMVIFNSCNKKVEPDTISKIAGKWTSSNRVVWDSLNPIAGVAYPLGFLYPSRKDTFDFQDENLDFQTNGDVYFKSSFLTWPFGYPMLPSINKNHSDTVKYIFENKILLCTSKYKTDTLRIFQIDNTNLILYKIAGLHPRKLEFITHYMKK